MDLVVERGGRRYGFEFKTNDSPGITDSMRHSVADLELEKIFVVYPGGKDYSLNERIRVVASRNLPQLASVWETNIA
jgi:hypothetical protein